MYVCVFTWGIGNQDTEREKLAHKKQFMKAIEKFPSNPQVAMLSQPFSDLN